MSGTFVSKTDAFFAYASQVMRSVILNSVREWVAEKRSGERVPLTLLNSLAANVADGEESILNVHEALEDLEKADPRGLDRGDALLRRLQRARNR